MSMFSITGQVVNTFEAPGRAANEKAGVEAQEAKPKVQILGEMPVPGGQTRVELVTLTCEDQRVYEALRGQTVQIPLGIFAPAKGQIIYFIPKGSFPVILGGGGIVPPTPSGGGTPSGGLSFDGKKAA